MARALARLIITVLLCVSGESMDLPDMEHSGHGDIALPWEEQEGTTQVTIPRNVEDSTTPAEDLQNIASNDVSLEEVLKCGSGFEHSSELCADSLKQFPTGVSVVSDKSVTEVAEVRALPVTAVGEKEDFTNKHTSDQEEIIISNSTVIAGYPIKENDSLEEVIMHSEFTTDSNMAISTKQTKFEMQNDDPSNTIFFDMPMETVPDDTLDDDYDIADDTYAGNASTSASENQQTVIGGENNLEGSGYGDTDTDQAKQQITEKTSIGEIMTPQSVHLEEHLNIQHLPISDPDNPQPEESSEEEDEPMAIPEVVQVLRDGSMASDDDGALDRPQGASLAFVFDFTGSMHDDLMQLKLGAERIMATMLEREDKPIYNYVLVPFHDPKIGPVTVTRDHEEFRKSLQDIVVHGGTDCPEMAIGAIKLALEHSLPNSFIYVFTDASAKDYHLLPDVLKLIQKKQSQVTFVMTGDCGDSSLIGYKVYERIAHTSSGQVYSLNKSDVEEVLHFVRESLQLRKVNLLSVVKPGPSTEEHKLNVDESLQEFTVAVSGRNPQIGVVNPSGKAVEGPPKLKPLLSLETVKVVNVNEPEPGEWKLKVSSDSEHSVRSTGLSDIDFNFGFSVVATTKMEETYHRPLKGAKNSVLVQPTHTHAEELHNITVLKLIDLKGNIFKEIPLSPVEGETGLYRGDTFIPPNDFFHLGVDGFGKDGYPLERISPTAITGQDPEPPVVNMRHHVTAWIGNSIRLRCRVESLIPFFVMWFKDGISIPLTGKMQYKQTSDILWEIHNPREMDEGNYTCYANNAKGSSKQGTWLSITGPAPEVEAASRVSSGVNRTVSLSCKVKSPLRYNVSWTRVYPRREAENLQSNEKTTVLANGTLLIHNVNTNDEAWYSCIVRSKGGKNESATYLSVWEAVQVTVTPERVDFKDGGTITLHCQATGFPVPVIYWKKGSETLSQDSDRRLTISEQPNGLDLNLVNANREDAGEYSCIADNDDEFDEGFVGVNYLEAPRAMTEKQNMVTGVGEDAILRCTVSGSPPPVIRWLKNEQDVIVSPKYQIFEDGSLVIRNAQISDSGTYTCVAENHAGREKDSVEVMVGMQPQMLQIPQNTEIEIMKNGSVPCIAAGQPAPLVTWERIDGRHQNRSRIFSTETGILLFTFAEIEDEGTYRCEVQNSLGRRVYDVNVTVTGIVKPILGLKNSNHAGTTVKRGMLVELPCEVLLSNPPPTVTWYKDGEVLGHEQMTWEGISVQANNSLIIPYTTQEHEGTYECVVSNVGGSASQSSTLHVLEPPVFLSSGTVTHKSRIGDKIILSCPALGDPEPIITWKKDGMPLLSSPTVYKNPEDNSLVINDATVGDSGTYACTAANSAGEARKFMVLFVQEPPHILSEADTVDAIDGQAVTITCKVKAVPNPIIHWYKDGTPLETYGNGIIYLNNNASIRFVAHVSTSGTYICEAENEAGSDRKEMMLKVLVPPTVYPPDDEFYTVNTSQSLRLSCLVSGYPQPNIRWEHNGVLLDTTNITANSNGTLFIDNIQPKMAGVYVCDAENAAGITQKVFYILVHVQPRIEVEFPTHVKLMEGDDFSLPCSARGYPSPEISWRKDGKSIFGNQTENLTVLEEGTLVISSATLETTGIYTCSAENAEGDDTKHFLVEVLVPPSMLVMEDSKVEVIEGDSVVITCPAKPAIPPPEIHWLKDGQSLDLKLNERSDMPHFTLLDGGHSLKLEEASPQDKGTYSCIATNLAGQTDAEFKLDVLLAPYFDEFDNYKQDFTVVAGTEVKLECDVGGNPPPRISWRRNNLPVTPHTAPGVMLSPDKRILLIPKVKTMNAGRYQCSANNKAGRMDRDFHITVLVPPELEGPGQETHEVVKGEPLLLQCPMSGYPEPSIKWVKNGLDLPNDFEGNHILSEDEKILEISHIEQHDAGIYACIGTNEAADKKKTFSVIVLEPPIILQDKEVEDYKVRAGEGISLVCKAHGSPIPDVKWLHNGHLVEGKEMTSELSNNLEGKYFVEEHVLTLHNVDVQDGGKYTCLASSIAGVAEKSYRVRILVAPKLAEYRQGSKTIESLEGLPVMLKCPVVGDPMPNIHWMKDSEPLDNQMEANGQMLHIKNIRKEHAGNYTCIAQNNAGNISQSFQLDILEPPVMADSQEPSSSSFQVVANEDLTLRCNVTGRPPPNVLWFKGASPITPERWPQAKFLDHNRTLVIPKVSLKLGGRYSCLASNMAGDRELLFNVEVQEPPDIPSELPEFSEYPVLLHRRLVLKCPITGSPLPKITWYKDGVPVHKELGSNVHISSDGKQLHLMHAQVRNSGNYSCLAENSAGSKELHFGVQVTVPAEWSTWTGWSECSVTCGQGEQIRVRVCGEDVEEFVEESYCPGEAEQIQACHIAECPIDGSWSEWSEWTSCSESCGHATRRRYRKCDNPPPAFGGKPCLGSDAQQEYCKQPPCPVNGNWSGWSEWSECSTTCGNGIKHRTRKCNNPPPAFGGKICFGLDLDIQDCNPHKCPVNGNWANWGEWSSCTVTCGQGSKRRFRTCTNPAPRYKGANCKGENLQIEKCRARSCGDVPLQASLTVKGKLNGEDLNEKVIAANISDLGPKRTVSATLKNILKQQAGWFPYLTFLLPPVSWNAAYELDEANNGFSLTHGNFRQQSLIEFSSGEELVVRHTGKGIDESGALQVEIEVDGEVPLVQPEASVVVEPYEEDYVQTGPSTLYTSSENAFNINGRKLPYTWNNTVMYDMYQGTMPYLVEKLQTKDIDLDYDPGLQQMTYIMSTAIKKKYDSDKCPEGFVRDEEHLHCRDIDECEDRQTNRCHFTQICENIVGTYRCYCRSGFKSTRIGKRCLDVNECIENPTICSHQCRNTKGSFKCICPRGMILLEDGRTCTNMWSNSEDQYMNPEMWPQLHHALRSGGRRSHSYDIAPYQDMDYRLTPQGQMHSWSCPEGFEALSGVCQDIDECRSLPNVCNIEQTCLNTKGSYRCLETPCPTGYERDLESRNCVMFCDEPGVICKEGALLTQTISYVVLTLDSREVQPYQDLMQLVVYGEDGRRLPRTRYRIVENETGKPFRVRIENQQGILYTLKSLKMGRLYRIAVLALSYDEYEHNVLYITKYIIFINLFDDTQYK